MTVNIRTYIGLTLLSIIIQFTVMEITKDDLELDEKPNQTFDLNLTSHKRKLEDVLNYLNKKPHALYYRTDRSVTKEKSILPSARIYSNTSLAITSLESSTDMTTNVVHELYDDDTSSAAITTDVAYTTTEIDNVTEITFFDKKNETTIRPNITKKTTTNKDCMCNLLYGACDINCCCDSDCSEADVKVFTNCDEAAGAGESDTDDLYFCYSHAPHTYWQYKNKAGNLFCIVKNNLPAKRNIHNVKYDPSAAERSFKWHTDLKYKHPNEFKRKPYTYGDHVWVLKNGSIRYVDLPLPILNDYCTGRKSLKFLKDEKITCTVKLKDLEMFQILKASEDATLVSVASESFNSSDLNCSTLYCTNWTFKACDGAMCVDYNKNVHEPSCTESYCINLALKVDYIFYYYDSKIINATINIHIQKVSISVPFMTQEINVKFMITNGSIENVVPISGNPGYVSGLPVIVSFVHGNHTENFFNNSSLKKYIRYPNNKNGICTLSNTSNNYLTFQSNKRLKCRFHYANDTRARNETDICNNISNNIKELFDLNDKVVVSPYGNPQDISDEEWLPLHNNILDKDPVYGEYNEGQTKLHCFNMITRKSFIFTFAHTSDKVDKQKILNAKIELHVENVTFIVDEISTVLTIDSMFLDQSRPGMYEYAAGPHFNIRLPKDFFFPFPQNRSSKFNYVSHIIIYFCVFITK